MPGTNFTWTRMSGGLKRVQDALEAIDAAWNTTVAEDTITNAMVKSTAAIAFSKLAALTSAYLLVGNGSNVATAVAITGDIGITNAGVTSITAGSIINADVKSDAAIAYSKLNLAGSVLNADIGTSAAIAYSKLATLTDGYILVGSGTNVCTAVAMSGDASIANDGTVTVTDLTISGEAQGEILYNNGSGWESLNVGTAGQALITAGAGSNPYWGEPSVALASKLTGSFVMEGGTYDITHAVTAQTTSAPTLTIPDFAGASDTYAFLALAQNFTGVKTFNQTSLALKGGDSNACTIKINETMTAGKTLNIKVNDTDRTIDLGGNLTLANSLTTSGNYALTLTQSGATNVTLPTTGTLATVAGVEALTNKTLTSPTITTMLINDGDAGCTLTSADQTDGGATVTIPDIGDAADNMVLEDTAQTLTNKTLTAPKIVTTGYIADGGGDEYLVFTEADTPVTYINITSGNTTVAPKVQGAGETNTDLHLLGSGTGNVYISDGTDPTKDINFELNGATTASTMTIISSQSEDRSLTLPDATDTLVGKATTDVFTNKSIDADGTGNVITNINANELDSITGNTYGIPFIIKYALSNEAAAVAIYDSNAPFKFRVLDAWSVNTSADGGTWKLDNGTNDLCSAVTVAASDADIDRIVDLDDDYHEIAASGSLRIVPDGGGALDCIIYISCLRVD